MNGKRFEFKFTYDADMGVLEHELDSVEGKSLKQAYAERPPHDRVVLYRLYADIANKSADGFVWINLSRDLSEIVDEETQSRICVWKWQHNWDKKHPRPDCTYLAIADRFIQRVQAEVPVEKLIKEEIHTSPDTSRGGFPATYHFWFVGLGNPLPTVC